MIAVQARFGQNVEIISRQISIWLLLKYYSVKLQSLSNSSACMLWIWLFPKYNFSKLTRSSNTLASNVWIWFLSKSNRLKLASVSNVFVFKVWIWLPLKLKSFKLYNFANMSDAKFWIRFSIKSKPRKPVRSMNLVVFIHSICLPFKDISICISTLAINLFRICLSSLNSC